MISIHLHLLQEAFGFVIDDATEIEYIYLIQVFDTRLPYAGAHRFQFLGVRSVKIIEHTECDAQCKTKKHECHKYQT